MSRCLPASSKILGIGVVVQMIEMLNKRKYSCLFVSSNFNEKLTHTRTHPLFPRCPLSSFSNCSKGHFYFEWAYTNRQTKKQKMVPFGSSRHSLYKIALQNQPDVYCTRTQANKRLQFRLLSTAGCILTDVALHCTYVCGRNEIHFLNIKRRENS